MVFFKLLESYPKCQKSFFEIAFPDSECSFICVLQAFSVHKTRYCNRDIYLYKTGIQLGPLQKNYLKEHGGYSTDA